MTELVNLYRRANEERKIAIFAAGLSRDGKGVP